MSSRSAEKDRTDSAEEYGSDSAAEEVPRPQPRRRQRTQTQQRQQQRGGQTSAGPLDQLPVGGELGQVGQTANGVLGGVTNTLGSVTNNAVDNQAKGDGGKSDTLRLRLDLNLDIEIQLKAKIHGDLELALLTG
ncbi:uncharacterized protein TRIREDRAFT_72581 [Trichoderma reesei QM6a]|uniref:Predicted protein n=3 Tax=Trichoderma TaxID=5543 RepID=G0RBF6_HYPJQ|nr:uncharacterized protein TRIREDRAFT_72581 [Trichoderma reesei QM6a]EGR51045.1 predicted protein [Trichoderma reesei QM6a]ETS04842.1 hypothetical protein M419DRAFT_96684 [Trichoderma reesei RUT C-30]OTA05921.1 hypothetical protein A9Z42_0066330 [Trichoderma parareesei]